MIKIGITGEFAVPTRSASNSEYKIISIAPRSYEDIRNLLQEVDFYILGGPEYLNQDLLASAKSLRAVAVMGTGTPSFVDVEAARKLNIRVYNVPTINSRSVAEFAQSILFLSQARLFHSIEELRSQRSWFQSPRPSFKDSKVGVVGLGACGKELIKNLRAAGVTDIKYYSRGRNFVFEETQNVQYMELKDLVQYCDLVSLHLSYNSESEDLFNESIFKSCKPQLQLFNFSNPKVVNPFALKSALDNSQIDFFYMDGYYHEWTEISDDPFGLLGLPPGKFVASSHIAAQENHTVQNVFDRAFELILSHHRNSI